MSADLRVLLVEDSEDDALLVLHALREGGFAPVHRRVDSEGAFLAALREEPWDIVISDYSMPGFDGLKAFDLHEQVGLDIPFLFVSGRIGEERAVEAMRRGVTDYLQKDNLNRLAPAVHRELRELATRRQRREMAEALRTSEDRLRRLAHNAPDIIYEYIWEPQPHFAFVSPAAEEITGYAPAAHYRDPGLWLDIVHEDDSALLHLLLAPTPDPAETATIMRWRHRDGRQRWVEQHTAPIRDESGRAVGIEGIVRDISERKALEAQLLSAQRMEAIGRLAGGIAHDFNNMLTVISGYCSLLRRKLDGQEPPLRDLGKIEDATERSAALVRQLLAFSRRQPRNLQRLDVNRVISDFAPMLRRLIREDIHLEIKPGRSLGPIRADRSQIEQVLMNLAVNARDAMPDGGRIVIETNSLHVPESAPSNPENLRPGHYVRLTVSDTGTGMTEEVKARVFDPFFTTKEVGTGTGLGLSTVYGIVKQMDGDIWVLSEPGAGTTFGLYLPCTEASAPEPEAQWSGAPPRGGETILLVEDEELVRQATEQMLADHGYQVLTAANGMEALQQLLHGSRRVDLLFTDLLMPRMNGVELAQRAREVIPDLRVLYVTGYTDAPLPGQRTPADTDSLLQKPFASNALLQKVREVLSRTPHRA